jgi:CheY-like chemotaxis protein
MYSFIHLVPYHRIPSRPMAEVTGVVVLVGLSIILFEVCPEKSVWSTPLRQADDHMIVVPGTGGFNLLITQKQEAYKTLTREQQRFRKRILIVDDDADLTTTFKAIIEDSNNDPRKRIEVHTSNDPVAALSEFKPDYYDLVLVDINMSYMNGFELCEKILAIDINVKVCFMSTVEINCEALREIYPTLSVGYFIRKPDTMDYLLKRIRSELD